MSEGPGPGTLLELAAAYQRSKAFAALLELDVPSRLAQGAHTAGEIAAQLDAHSLAIGRLLDAGVALGVLVREGDRFANTPAAQTYLVRGADGDLSGAFRRLDRASRSPTWTDLGARMRAWRPGTGANRPSNVAAPVGDEVAGEHRLSLLVGCALARAVDFSAHTRVVDLGGGTGAMSIALCTHYRELRAVLVERPEVAPVARAHVEASGLADRIEVVALDFLTDPLPEGDAVLLANVMSMLESTRARALLARLSDALPPGGLCMITGWMLDERATGPLLALLLSLEDIALDAPDVERPWAVYADWLVAAGFDDVRAGALVAPASWVAGRRVGRRAAP